MPDYYMVWASVHIGWLHFLAGSVAEPFGSFQSLDLAAAETKLDLNLRLSPLVLTRQR